MSEEAISDVQQIDKAPLSGIIDLHLSHEKIYPRSYIIQTDPGLRLDVFGIEADAIIRNCGDEMY